MVVQINNFIYNKYLSHYILIYIQLQLYIKKNKKKNS